MSIVFHRLEGKSFLCKLCPEGTEIQSRVIIAFVREKGGGETDVSLCPRHEHELLERLCNNYEKRLRKGQTRPHALPLRKETPSAAEDR